MEKKKSMSSRIIVGIFATVFILSIFITEIMAANGNQIQSIDMTSYKSNLEAGEESLVLLTKNDCTKCDTMLETLKDIKNDGLNVYTINVDELSEGSLDDLLDSSDLINDKDLPSVIHLSAGAVIGTYTGEANYNDIMSFYKSFDVINVAKFLEMYKEDQEYFVYVGRPTCGYCVQSEPLTKRVAYELNKEIYHINIDEETSSDLQKLAEATEGVYKGATPLFMVVKNGKVVDYKEGAGSYSELLSFFKDVNK